MRNYNSILEVFIYAMEMHFEEHKSCSNNTTCQNASVDYVSPTGYHRHKCGKCGCIWEHSNDMRGNDDAHKCPKCSEEQWVQYRGNCIPCVYQKLS
jgi:hypothetical protein